MSQSWDDGDRLVTGEAVAVDLPVARLPSRMLALSLDLTVQLLLLAGVLVLAGTVADAVDPALAVAITLVLVVLVIVGLPTAVETLSGGRSLGKLVMGLRVVRDDGGPTRFRHALVRALFMFFVDLWLTSGSVGLIASLASQRGKRVGDHFAGTVVVRERVPARATAAAGALAVPPPLAGWAAHADLARVPDDLALALRQFLGRADQLDPRVRQALARDLATRAAMVVAPPAPAGTPAEAYLTAVVAERSRRAWWAQQEQAARWAQAAAPAPPLPAATPPPAAPTPPLPAPTPPPATPAPPLPAPEPGRPPVGDGFAPPA